MAESPLTVLAEMIRFLIDGVIFNFKGILDLYGRLLASVGISAEVGGPVGLGLSVLLVGLIGYLVAKFLLGEGKIIAILLVIGFVLGFIALMSAFI